MSDRGIFEAVLKTMVVVRRGGSGVVAGFDEVGAVGFYRARARGSSSAAPHGVLCRRDCLPCTLLIHILFGRTVISKGIFMVRYGEREREIYGCEKLYLLELVVVGMAGPGFSNSASWW